MKILHINDQAGISLILSKYLIKRGIDSKVILSSRHDKFGIKKYYENLITYFPNRKTFEKQCIQEAEHANLVHVHSLENMIILLRKKYGKSKKIILHYHGTDLRGIKNQPYRTIKNRLRYNYTRLIDILKTKILLTKCGHLNSLRVTAQQLADEILVSTPDLLPLVKNGIYFPNLIDMDLFKRIHNIEGKREALIINNEATNTQKSLEYCKENNVDLDIEIYNRIDNPLMYSEMPNLLRKYKIYVDVRFSGNQLITGMSKTALESLACGLTVLDNKLEYIKSFPKVHEPDIVINKLLELYSLNKTDNQK